MKKLVCDCGNDTFDIQVDEVMFETAGVDAIERITCSKCGKDLD